MAKQNVKENVQEEAAKQFIQEYLKEEPTVEQVPTEVSKWQDLPLANLPLAKLYHPGFKIEFKAAEVAEIQHYSTIENDSAYDIRNKLNGILNTCLRVTLPNRKLGSYLDLKIGDRLYLIYTIREITFQKGQLLTVPVVCTNKKCKQKFEIELIRHYLEMWENSDVWQFYDPSLQSFVFETILNEKPFVITLPSIGVQEGFKSWMEDKKYKNEKIKDSFIKIAPYLINKPDITIEEINEFETRFDTSISIEEFQFLNDVINKFKNNEFKLGIKGLKKECSKCGMEVRTTKIFPERASDIFIIPNAFDRYLKK